MQHHLSIGDENESIRIEKFLHENTKNHHFRFFRDKKFPLNLRKFSFAMGFEILLLFSIFSVAFGSGRGEFVNNEIFWKIFILNFTKEKSLKSDGAKS
jgi:hypothetical protein